MRTHHPAQAGFTLIEIIAVLVILGVLAATAIPKYIELQEDAQRKAAVSAVAEAQSRINLSFAQFLLAGGNCARLTTISLTAPYAQPQKTATTLSVADEDNTLGGWRLTPEEVASAASGDPYLQLTSITPPDADPSDAITIQGSDQDASSFRLYFPQCGSTIP